jgi:heme A synthase
MALLGAIVHHSEAAQTCLQHCSRKVRLPKRDGLVVKNRTTVQIVRTPFSRDLISNSLRESKNEVELIHDPSRIVVCVAIGLHDVVCGVVVAHW